jgi:hypothetical protein
MCYQFPGDERVVGPRGNLIDWSRPGDPNSESTYAMPISRLGTFTTAGDSPRRCSKNGLKTTDFTAIGRQ